MKLTRLFTVPIPCGRVILTLLLLPAWQCFAQLPYPVPGVNPVRITSPANHATFYAPVDIPIFAFARLPVSIYPPISPIGGLVTYVEFYAGSNDLGSGFNIGATTLPTFPIYANFFIKPYPSLSGNYCLTWSNPPAGVYVLTAVAKTSAGLSRTSAPVNVTILTSPTNANPMDTVSIFATDPVAIAGTNAWVWRGLTNTTSSWTNWNRATLQWFTNWGPKNATFTVGRFGNAISNLTVNFSIGGTASNGVDYAALPDYVTIPAGAAYTLIPIVPIDHGASNVNKTVILVLKTNAAVEYRIGFPARAAALILENWRRAPSALLPDGSFHLAASGPDGAWFYVQYTTDLVNWQSVSTNQVFQGSIDFVDPDANNYASRFYRAVPVGETTAP